MTLKNEVARTLPTVHYTMNEDATLLIKNSELLANAYIDSNTSLKVESLTNPQGTLINNNNATWSFTPSKYFTGSLTLECIISDGEHKAVQKIKIDVMHISHYLETPEVDLLLQEDGTFLISARQLLQNATDIEGDNLEIIEMSAPQGIFNNNYDSTWTFIPSPEYLGAIDLKFVVTEGKASVIQNLLITVNTPVFMPEIDFIMNENDSFTFSSDDLLQSVHDIDGDLLAITDLQTPDEGQIINNDNGTWTYIPPENYVGPSTLQFGVADDRGAVVDQTINIFTISENFANMQPKNLLMQEDGTVVITPDILLDANITANAKLTISNLATTQGSIEQFGNANDVKWLFTPNDTFTDTIELQYTINDGSKQTPHFITIDVFDDLQ